VLYLHHKFLVVLGTCYLLHNHFIKDIGYKIFINTLLLYVILHQTYLFIRVPFFLSHVHVKILLMCLVYYLILD